MSVHEEVYTNAFRVYNNEKFRERKCGLWNVLCRKLLLLFSFQNLRDPIYYEMGLRFKLIDKDIIVNINNILSISLFFQIL